MSKTNSYNKKLNILYIIIFVFYFYFFPQIKIFISPISDSFFSKINFQNIFLSEKSFSIKTYFSNLDSLKLDLLKITKELEIKQLEIMSLREQLNASTNASSSELLDQNLISAKVLNQDYLNFYNQIILNKGFIDGVGKNNSVFLYPNYYLGKIGRIEKDISFLILASDYKDNLKGLIKNVSSSTNLSVDLLGRGAGDFSLEIPESLNILVGTKIYLAEDETKEVGSIVKIDKIESSLYQKVLVRGYYNPSQVVDYYIQVK